MMVWDEKAQALWKNAKIFAFAFLVAAPVTFIAIAYILDAKPKAGGEYDMVLYILLIVAAVQPLFGKFIARFQINAYRKNPVTTIRGEQTRMTPGQLYINVLIIQMALVEAIYVYGLFQVILTGEINRMFYFYPIGLAWSFVYWPKRSHFENFVQKLESQYGQPGS